MKWIKIPIEVECIHKSKNPDRTKAVEMEVSVSDPEVPTYLAVCPKCGKTVIIAFGDFLHKEQETVLAQTRE
jgi:hypothetical protein